MTERQVAVETMAEMESARQRFRQRGREAMGVTGSDQTESIRAALKRHRLGLYPLVALGLLSVVDQFQGSTLIVLAPEISRALGVSVQIFTGAILMYTVALALATLPMAALTEARPRRALIAKVTGLAWTAVGFLTAFVTSAWQLVTLGLLNGISSGSVYAVHSPLLTDTYPPALRSRVLHGWRAFFVGAGILSPLLVAVFTGPLQLTWRGTFLAFSGLCLIAALVSLRLRDPGSGRWDTDRIRAEVRAESGPGPDALTQEETRLRFFEIVRRLLMIPTLRRFLLADAMLGMLVAPLLTYLSYFLEQRWGLSPDRRGLFFAGVAVFAVVGVVLASRGNERRLQRDPAQLIRFGVLCSIGTAVAIVLAIASPFFWGTFVMLGVFSATLNTRLGASSTAFFTMIRPEWRTHASALSQIFLYGVGGFAGLVLLGGLDQRYGLQGAIVAMLAPCAVSALVLWGARKTINADLDRMVDDLVEEEELKELSAKGARLSMLSCRKVDFSYGQLQVLFGVDFTVDEGEMVALLGTNGAGKSTLLRVISGLGLPSRGSVRYRGADITYLDAERRVRLGITQVPGGRAVFGPLTVVENLRVFGYTAGHTRASVHRAIDVSLDAFPRLAERRNSVASTLSGGEQQMLGLSKALILKPRLLLIDELSLGLAPKIVSQLLGMVRLINEGGTAVVLVEQSVNVALSLVNHAYFMEKGEIRFDGRAEDLIGRGDLLRSVFLEGAAAGMTGNGQPPLAVTVQ